VDDFMNYLKQKEEINLEIKKSLASANIDIAFPTQELIIKE
jgi:small-conductance mechanosensitive channel